MFPVYGSICDVYDNVHISPILIQSHNHRAYALDVLYIYRICTYIIYIHDMRNIINI